ncbi:hypothetical protein FBEOM_5821 [Fusarium beomiforme]|uniref:Uncharacterized protein n=1 Tax=Fusarium beomiforme TaxID=44412 RepID=A0A9P5AKA3_9HYPO|nr:hypothetical protein FBEOM_5821 [Fusarium beomiforme]
MADVAVESYSSGIVGHEREPSPTAKSMFPAEEVLSISVPESTAFSKKKRRKKRVESEAQLGPPRLSLSHGKTAFEDEFVASEPHPVVEAPNPVPLGCKADAERAPLEVDIMPAKEEVTHKKLVESPPVEQTNDAADTTITPPVPGEPEEPIYLPFSAQYKLLVHLQQRLENMCFSFAKRVMPDLLQRRGWECAEMVQLQHWMKDDGFQDYVRQKVHDIEQADQLLSLSLIHICTLHRKPINASGLRIVLSSSVELAKVLEEPDSVEEIDHLHGAVAQTTQRLTEETRVLQAHYDAKLHEIAVARAKLDTWEEKTKEFRTKRLEQSRSKANDRIITLIREAECATPKAALPGGSTMGSCLDWVNDLESSLALGDDVQEDVL